MKEYIKNHKIATGIIIFLILIFIATIISIIINSTNQQATISSEESERGGDTAFIEDEDSNIGNSTYGTTLVISNWSEYVENLPDDERDQAETTLYDTVIKNLPTGRSLLSTDSPEIRADSYDQTYDPVTQIYYTNFLIDIPSLKQTYRFLSQYSDLPREESGLFDYTIQVSCPNKSDLIWDEFKCIDRLKMEEG